MSAQTAIILVRAVRLLAAGAVGFLRFYFGDVYPAFVVVDDSRSDYGENTRAVYHLLRTVWARGSKLSAAISRSPRPQVSEIRCNLHFESEQIELCSSH